MKDADIRGMSRADLEDEVMLLRAHVKVLQNEVAKTRERDERLWPSRGEDLTWNHRRMG